MEKTKEFHFILQIIFYSFLLLLLNHPILARESIYQYTSIVADLHHSSCNHGLYHLQKLRNTHPEKNIKVEIEVISRSAGKVVVNRETYKVNPSDFTVLGCTAERLKSGTITTFQRTILKVGLEAN